MGLGFKELAHMVVMLLVPDPQGGPAGTRVRVSGESPEAEIPRAAGHPSSLRASNRWDEAHPHDGGSSVLLSLLT